MKYHAADQLHIEGNHFPDDVLAAYDGNMLAFGQASAGVLHDREGLRQQIVERLPLTKALLELRRFRLQLFVHQALVFLFEGVDLVHERQEALDFALIFRAEDFFNEPFDHKSKAEEELTNLSPNEEKREAKMYRSAASVGKEGTFGISTIVILSLSKDLPERAKRLEGRRRIFDSTER